MADPRFSESQLQSAVNGAFVRHAWEKHKKWLLPYVVSLWDEFDLGWDTAFVAPWLGVGHPDQEGCNLFIQYKLSEQLVSPGAAQWAHWSEPYFRFKIPHSTLDVHMKYVDDFHQWKSLVKLAKAGYATFYATNTTLCKKELRAYYNAGTLLDQIAWLDVNDVKLKKHRHVTFTAKSTFFFLHSEIEEVRRRPVSEALSRLADEHEQESLARANARLITHLAELGEEWRTVRVDDSYLDDIEHIRGVTAGADDARSATYTHMLLRSFVHRHFGAALLWVPRLAG